MHALKNEPIRYHTAYEKIKNLENDSKKITDQTSYNQDSAMKLQGDYMSIFEDQIKSCEKLSELSIQKKHGVIYIKM